MVYIIGSGPASVSCALALLKQGIEVTMLDGGLELETEREKLLHSVRQSPENEWNDELLKPFKENTVVDTRGVPLKLVYGSDFPYQAVESHLPMKTQGIDILPSLARGGLSNVWGGVVLPYRDSDIDDWPITISDLALYYEAVFKFIDLAAMKDDLENLFPLYSTMPRPLIPSRQTVELMRDFNKYSDQLKVNNIYFGYSRLAVRSYAINGQSGCVYCGCCLYGCPHELIYNSSFTLMELMKNPDFTYIKDVVVEKVAEAKGEVTIRCREMQSGKAMQFKASRVYLGCGVLPTTRILLESLEAHGHVIEMQDSQYFVLPLLRYRNVSEVSEECLHTLSQVFIEILDKKISEHTVHLQVYTYNDLYLQLIKNKLNGIYPLFNLPIQAFLGRLLIVQGYLHSDQSSTASVYLKRGEKNQPSCLYLTMNENSQTLKTIRAVADKLILNRKYLRLVPLFRALYMGRFGKGFHSGGTFPMKRHPSAFECDILGRPYGFERVHIVDATTFPSIPATTITLTVMANAYRIASLYNET